jgi:hypothetical protein
MTNSKYKLAIVELFNIEMHGITDDSTKGIQTHFMVNEIFNPHELIFDYNDPDPINFDNMATYSLHRSDAMTIVLHPSKNYNNYIRNYYNIACNISSHYPIIAQCLELPGGELVAINKMFAFKCLQRKWKSIFKERKNIINARKNNANIRYRERNGKWPPPCNDLPSLQGMLVAN